MTVADPEGVGYPSDLDAAGTIYLRSWFHFAASAARHLTRFAARRG